MARLLKVKRTEKSSKSKVLEEGKKGRKTDEDSIYTKLDIILESYGILRAAYHVRDLTGVDISEMFERS